MDLGTGALWERIRDAALEACRRSTTAAEIEQVRVAYLGRRGELTAALREVGRLTPAERPAAGEAGNRVREAIETALAGRLMEIADRELVRRLQNETVDVTLPGRRPAVGHSHPLSTARRDIERIFTSMGFAVADGPEVESDWYNFEALNMPVGHPARDMHDSFYVDAQPGPDEPAGRMLLRTHTSPVQIRYMRARAGALPVRIVAPGRIYRRDDDATHSPMFHQIEGLLVDRDVTFAHLKGVLAEVARRLFGPETGLRLRPSYFPFTEPSAEADASCVFCRGTGCATCKGSGWIEILGCGMVHPRVLEFGGYDPEEVSGFAFGMGIDRVAMLRYRIHDIRLLFEGDLRFCEQF